MTIELRKNIKTIFLGGLLLASFTVIAKPIEKNTLKDVTRITEQGLNAVLWQQSAEAKALYYQTFNLARWQLEQKLRTYNKNKLPAIVMDIDETLLDNSPYAARMIANKQSYPKGWFEWINEAKAKPLPGALEFLNYATSQSVTIFYITNRKIDKKEATLQNLKNYGFPQLKDSHLLFKTTDESKENRRQTISATYEIIMLIGDKLTDLSSVFDQTSLIKRNKEVTKLRDAFGQKFILLPNPMYGDWLDAETDYRHDLLMKTVMDKRLKAIKTN
ncbi:MAG: 5-nucleotidase, lipoprotein e(P4) family [Gammaproteobacteria bacterium]|jgi:5'-nucleotidase (lipoprotein e(P4) family)|nr:5-nucleotidase, lipoprotein e(P4) family [Gammaproteobacteria bacterium]